MSLVAHRRDARGTVTRSIEKLREIEKLVKSTYGIRLSGLELLDVGAGQLLLELRYFARSNEVTGIDSDVIAQGLDPRTLVAIMRANGWQRFAKTLGRKLMGIDARHAAELQRQLSGARGRPMTVHRMDAAHMTFPADRFGFVYALAVFQHLPDPARVLDEMIRVTRPGGVLYLDLILYTSRTGSHDVRTLSGRDAELPLWAHLRPEHAAAVEESAYLNRMRLDQWRELFESRLPDHRMLLRQPEASWLGPEVHALQGKGELKGFMLEELLTSKVVVLWRKPERLS